MNNITKKQWLVFFLIAFYHIFELLFVTKYLIPNRAQLEFFAVYYFAIIILAILIPIFLIHFVLKEPLADYGIHFKKLHLQILYGVLWTCAIGFLLGGSFTLPFERLNTFLAELKNCDISFFVNLLVTIICAVGEEIVFRGFLLTFFQKCYSNNLVIVAICAVIFGLSHYPMTHYWPQVFGTSLLGFLDGYVRVKYPEKFTVISLSISHILHNLFFAG